MPFCTLLVQLKQITAIRQIIKPKSILIQMVVRLSKLSIKNISKSFPNGHGGRVHVLDDISFDIEECEFVSLLGPSGCGKTTLLKIIAGLIPPDEGKVVLDGDLLKTGHSRVGYIFQQESLFPWLTVRQNVEFGLKIKGRSSEDIRKISDEMISLVGMSGLEDNYPYEISGGQSRKIEMARSLVTSPDILVSDEALSNLDAQTRNYLQEEILRIWETTGSTILFVTHNVDEAVYTADRIIVLSNMPATIISEFKVEIPRPRTRTSQECLQYRHKILEILRVEQVKALKRIEGLPDSSTTADV